MLRPLRLLQRCVVAQEVAAHVVREQRAGHADRARCVEHMQHGTGVGRRDLHRCVAPARGRATDEQRHAQAGAAQLCGNIDHLFERGCDEATQPHEIDLLAQRSLHNAVGRNHDAEVDDVVVVAGQHDRHDVLSDVVNIALHGGHQDALSPLHQRRIGETLRLHVGDEPGHRPLHGACALHHLRQEHLARAEEVSDHRHAGHQRPLDDRDRSTQFGERLLGIGLDEGVDSLHQRVRQPLRHRAAPPGIYLGLRTHRRHHGRSVCDEPFGGIGPTVQDEVFDHPEQRRLNLAIEGELASIHDAHVQAGRDGMVEEGRVERLTNLRVAAEGEGEVADAAAQPHRGKVSFERPHRGDEVGRVVGMLLHAGADGEDVGIEEDVLLLEALLLQDGDGARRDLEPLRDLCGLSRLVEGHDQNCRTEAPADGGLTAEGGLALLEAQRVHNRLALHAAEPSLDDPEVRRVDHDGQLCNRRLTRDQVQEVRHRLDGVQHRLVHVHIEDVCATLHLAPCNLERLVEHARSYEPCKLRRARHIGPLAHHHEAGLVTQFEQLQPCVAAPLRRLREQPRRHVRDGLCDGFDVVRRGPAAAAHAVDPAERGIFAQDGGGLFGLLVVLSKSVRKTGVRIDERVAISDPRERLYVGAHLGSTERAVDADRERLCVGDGVPEGLQRLAREGAAAAVGHRHRDHERNADAACCEDLLHGHDRRLGIERVEDGLDEEQIHAAVEQRIDLFGVGLADLIEGGRTEAGVVHIGREGERAVGRTDRTGDEEGPAGLLCSDPLHCSACDLGGRDVELARELLEPVVGLRDPLRREGVGLDDVGARSQILAVNLLEQRRLREREQIAVALEVTRPCSEPLSAQVGIAQPVALDHGPHRSVQNHNALPHQLGERSLLKSSSDGSGHGRTLRFGPLRAATAR